MEEMFEYSIIVSWCQKKDFKENNDNALWARDAQGLSWALLSLSASMVFITEGNPFNELSAFSYA